MWFYLDFGNLYETSTTMELNAVLAIFTRISGDIFDQVWYVCHYNKLIDYINESFAKCIHR